MMDSPEEHNCYLFRKACHFYSFLEGGELELLQKLVETSGVGLKRLNEILDLDREGEMIEEHEMEAVAKVIGIPLKQMLWNQNEMNRLYEEFNLDYYADVKDINKRVVNSSINPLQISHAVLAMIFSDGEADHREEKFFSHLKRTFSVSDEDIDHSDTSKHHFQELIASLPNDSRFISIVVKWIIGAVFADGEVSQEEVEKLDELLHEIQMIRGGLDDADLNLQTTT